MWVQRILAIVMLGLSVSGGNVNSPNKQNDSEPYEKVHKAFRSERLPERSFGDQKRLFELYKLLEPKQNVNHLFNEENEISRNSIQTDKKIDNSGKDNRHVEFQADNDTKKPKNFFLSNDGKIRNKKIMKKNSDFEPYTESTTTSPPSTTTMYYCNTQPYSPPPTTLPDTQPATYPPTLADHSSSIAKKKKRSLRRRRNNKHSYFKADKKHIKLQNGVDILLKCTAGLHNSQVVWEQKIIHSKIPVYYVRQDSSKKAPLQELFAPVNAQKDASYLCRIERFRLIGSDNVKSNVSKSPTQIGTKGKKMKEKNNLDIYDFVFVAKKKKRSADGWSAYNYPYNTHLPPTFQQYTRPASNHNNAFREQSPVLKAVQDNITVGPGETAKLKCKVENLGTKTLTWRKEDELHPISIGQVFFAPDSRMTLDHNGRNSEWTLTINDVKPSDEGTYLCQISSKHEDISDHITLNVKTIRLTGTDYVEKGNTIELMCNVTGKPDPPEGIDWFKGDMQIDSQKDEKVVITKKIETRILTSMLTIKNSQPSDSAEYTCQSTDQESSSIKVLVVNVSNQPIIKPGMNSYQLNPNIGFFFRNGVASPLNTKALIFSSIIFFLSTR